MLKLDILFIVVCDTKKKHLDCSCCLETMDISTSSQGMEVELVTPIIMAKTCKFLSINKIKASSMTLSTDCKHSVKSCYVSVQRIS